MCSIPLHVQSVDSGHAERRIRKLQEAGDGHRTDDFTNRDDYSGENKSIGCCATGSMQSSVSVCAAQVVPEIAFEKICIK